MLFFYLFLHYFAELVGKQCVWNERWKLSILVKDLLQCISFGPASFIFRSAFFCAPPVFFPLFPPQTSLFHPPNYFFHPLLRTLSLPRHGNFDYLAASSSDEKPWKGGGPTSCMTRKTGEGRKCRDTPDRLAEMTKTEVLMMGKEACTRMYDRKSTLQGARS